MKRGVWRGYGGREGKEGCWVGGWGPGLMLGGVTWGAVRGDAGARLHTSSEIRSSLLDAGLPDILIPIKYDGQQTILLGGRRSWGGRGEKGMLLHSSHCLSLSHSLPQCLLLSSSSPLPLFLPSSFSPSCCYCLMQNCFICLTFAQGLWPSES